MIRLLIAVEYFVGGGLVGAIVLARWYFYRLRKPEVLRDTLKAFYRQAHPHWLQNAPDDPTPICPCCGWSEKEMLATGASAALRQVFGIKVITVRWLTVPSGPFTGNVEDMTKHANKLQADHDASAAKVSGPYVAYVARPYTGTVPP